MIFRNTAMASERCKNCHNEFLDRSDLVEHECSKTLNTYSLICLFTVFYDTFSPILDYIYYCCYCTNVHNRRPTVLQSQVMFVSHALDKHKVAIQKITLEAAISKCRLVPNRLFVAVYKHIFFSQECRDKTPNWTRPRPQFTKYLK